MIINASEPQKWQTGRTGYFYECGEVTSVYFDPASGDTHLISEFAAYLLGRLAEAAGPLDLGEIIELVSEDVEAEYLPQLGLAIPETLNALVDLDIVYPA